MLKLTKIFHFEAAHAIHGYEGQCKHIHGHSYELHVTFATKMDTEKYIPGPGFIIDFKEIKKIVKNEIIVNFDHKLILSKQYIKDNNYIVNPENIVIWEMEPTVENLLLFIKEVISQLIPSHIELDNLIMYETKDSYAQWTKS